MTWVPIAVAGWLLLAVVIALGIGGGIRLADRRARRSRTAPDVVSDLRTAPSGGRSPVIRDCVAPAERRPSAPRSADRR